MRSPRNPAVVAWNVVSVAFRSGPERDTVTGARLPGFPNESVPSGPNRMILSLATTVFPVNERSAAPVPLVVKLAPSRTFTKLASVVVSVPPEADSRGPLRLRLFPG